MQNFLSDFQMAQIIREAESNPDFLDDKIMHFGKYYYSVIKVSKIHKLILIEGNEHTGFKHINKRHDFFDSQTDWKGNKLGTGSKFSSNSFGYFDYLKIADQVFDIENFIEEDRKNNDYETYKKTLNLFGKGCVYRLVVYKGTRIIHTLFPEKDISIWKRPEKFNFIRVVSNATVDYMNSIKRFTISYKNKKEIVYQISITKNYFLKEERIEIIDVLKRIVIFQSVGQLGDSFDNSNIPDFLTYKNADLTAWEQEIVNYIDNLNIR